MTVQYQSRFLRYWRIQVQRWQHHFALQQRRVQTSLKWTVQAWLYPLYRLVQVSHWLPSGLKQTVKQQWSLFQAQTDTPPPPASDSAIVNLLQSLEIHGLTLSSPSGTTNPTLFLNPPPPRPKSLLSQAWQQLIAVTRDCWDALSTLVHQVKPRTTPANPQLLGTPAQPALPAPWVEPEQSHRILPTLAPSHTGTIPWQAWWQWVKAQIPQTFQNSPQAVAFPPPAEAPALAPSPPELAQTPISELKHPWAWLQQFASQTRQRWQQGAGIIQPIRDSFTSVLGLRQSPEIIGVQSLNVVATSESNPPTQAIAIQGLACHLENRHLVLVSAEQQILDILTPAQQHQLTERILWELAGYYYQLRQWQKLTGHALIQLGFEASMNAVALPHLSDPKHLAACVRPSLQFGQLWQQFQAWLFGWPTLAAVSNPLTIATRPIPMIQSQTGQDLVTHPPRPTSPSLSPQSPQFFPLSSPFTIDISSTFLGYEPQGLEVIWLWLDRLFLWLERAWAWVLGVRLRFGN